MIEIADAINSLPSSAMQDDFVPTSEQLVTLTYGQLQELITQTVQTSIQTLLDEIKDLKATVASQNDKIAALEATQDTLSENQLIQLQLIHKMRDAPQTQQQTTQPTKKTTDHINDLHRLMVEDRTQQISIAKGARLLGISKERLRLLKPFIMQDGRFELGWSTVKGKKAVVIKIRQFLK